MNLLANIFEAGEHLPHLHAMSGSDAVGQQGGDDGFDGKGIGRQRRAHGEDMLQQQAADFVAA